MKDNHEQLGKFLREVSNWSWEEFVRAEHAATYTTNQSIIFTLIRACYMRKLSAIRIALNRLDGKLKTPVKIELPKVYYLFPNAKPPEALPEGEVVSGSSDVEVLPAEPAEDELPLTDLSLRQTLSKMSEFPRDLPQQICDEALAIEQFVRGNGPRPTDNPMVKAVVAASLLILAQSRDIDALTEVFDQLDGKLVETIQLLGDDLFITSYSTEVPPGAYLNKDGVLQIEATDSQMMWAERLKDAKHA